MSFTGIGSIGLTVRNQEANVFKIWSKNVLSGLICGSGLVTLVNLDGQITGDKKRSVIPKINKTF